MATRREFLQASGTLVVYFALPGCSKPADDGDAMFGGRLHLEAKGSVHLYMGKVELGQGIGTAIAQIAADEFGVDVARIQLVNVDTRHSPDESYTFSSISVQLSGPLVRSAAAAGRRFLLQKAAAELNIDVARLSVVDGAIANDGEPTTLDYWGLLTGEQIEIEPAGDETFLSATDYRHIGKSVPRKDIPGKVFGEESYLQDLRLPGMVHARVVRPPAERAELKTLNDSVATSLAGVLKVVRDGNFVAVIAEREQQARDAATALRKNAEWSLPGDLSGSDRVFEWLREAPVRTEPVVAQSTGAAEDTELTQVDARYQRPYQAHASISPSAAVALFEDDELTVWSHGQGMFPLRTALAHVFELPLDSVRCIHREAAGCFGHNGADDAACDAAAIALHYPGVPVRLQWERADEFAWEPYGSAMHIEMLARVDATGRIRHWNHDLWSCPHTSRPRSAAVAGSLIYAQHRATPLEIPAAQSIARPNGGADRNSVPIYAIDNVSVDKHLVTEMPLRVSALRGLGAYGNVFAIESFMDELAVMAGRDPLHYRLDHLEDERAIDVLQQLANVSQWDDRPPAGGREGWGLGFARFKNLSAYVGIVVRLSVDQGEIRVHKATAVCDPGLVINPDGVRAQIEGGIVQSTSWTLKEQVRFSKTRIESRDWSVYPILRFDEVPEVDVHVAGRSDRKSVGVGEAAQGPTAAAIANGVFHATGKRLRRLPLKL